MTSDVDDFLEHFGVKGMKWGVRKSDSSSGSESSPGYIQRTRNRFQENESRKAKDFSVTTKNGETVEVKEVLFGKLENRVSALSDKMSKASADSFNYELFVKGEMIGDASVDKRGKDELYLNWLGVEVEHRGKGYASAVFEAAVQTGIREGATKLTLEVPGKSPDARHIYEKNGFIVTREATKAEALRDPVWGGLTNMEYDLTKRSVKHSMTAEELAEDMELERAFRLTFQNLVDETELSMATNDTDDFLEHFGVKGMKWGQRKARPEGVSARTNRAASKDAAEFARAKMFYGEGAGTRRKLIKAQVEAKSKIDPSYKKAFDHHLERQDMGKQAVKAKSERRRKDVASKTTKTVKGAHRQLTGGMGNVSMASAALAGGYVVAKKTGADKVILDAGKKAMADLFNSRSNSQPDPWFKKNGFL